MADKKLSELTSITSADIASGDLLLVSDVSAGISKSITYGELTTITTGDLNFADNAKAIFGAGSDLQIYHDGSSSYIQDIGTGNLQIDCGDFRVRKPDGSEAMIQANADGAVNLFYDGGATPKLATTATGVDVTGTVTADGLTSSGNLNFDAVAINTISSNGFLYYNVPTGYTHTFQYNGTNVLNMNGQDISFYEDTGTTPKLFWDASDEKLFVGSTSSANTQGWATGYFVHNTGSNGAAIHLEDSNGEKSIASYNNKLYFTSGSTTDMLIDGAGNVGIGTSSPTNHNSSSRVLHHDGGALTRSEIRLTNATTGTAAGNGLLFATVGNDSYIYQLEAAPMIFGTSGSEVARLDASGNLLVGATTTTNMSDGTGNDGVALNPAGTLVAARTSNVSMVLNRLSTDGAIANFNKDGSTVGSIASQSSGTQLSIETGSSNEIRVSASGALTLEADREGNGGGDYIDFRTAGSERARINASGNLLVGTTGEIANAKLNIQIADIGAAIKALSNGNWAIGFYNTSGTNVGQIVINASSTSYNTTSDYRLKENVVDLTGAADRLKQIPVHRFNFIADPDRTMDGFLAHEVQDIVPEAITGIKDEVDADGNPVYQGIDQSKLVPLLTAALQEALTKIDDLEARIQTLEGN